MASAQTTARIRELLAVGSLFEGKYRIRRSLGMGNFAYVMLAEHEVMGRPVALKVLKPELVHSNPDVSERFLTEVRIISKLSHPNTVTVYDFGETEDGIYYMVLEFVRGVALNEVLEEGPLEPRRVVHITKQILKALDEAHALGVVHRDLKPSNIMLTEVHGEEDFVKVLDFGVAKLVDEAEAVDDFDPAPLVRRSTQFIGTPVYMSPEQVLGQEVVPASDLYSLGLMIYEMMTGDQPLHGNNLAQVAQQHIDEAPLALADIDLLTARFRNLIGKATSRYPQQRFQTVAEFARALPVVAGVDHSAEFVGIMEDLPRDLRTSDGDDDSDPAMDVFSGKNYIELPDEADIDEPERSSPRPRLQVGGRAGRRKKRQGAPQARREIRLDTSRIRRHEWEQQKRTYREPSLDGDMETSEKLRRVLLYAAGLTAAYFGFVMFSAVMEGVYGLVRAGAGVLPIVAAYLWTQFSSVGRPTRDIGQRWLMPMSLNLVYIFFMAFMILAIAFPAHATHAMSEEATWFFGGSADYPPFSWCAAVTDAFGATMARLFDLASSVIPW